MSRSEVERKFVFWVVYDATSDRQFVKMDSDTGCLAVFDTEECAAAFTSGLFGVNYKEVVLYSCPQPAPDMPGLTETLRQYRSNDGGGLVFGYDKLLVDQYVAELAEVLKSAKNLIANHSGEVLPDEYAGDQIEQIDVLLATYHSQRGDV